MTLGYVGLGAMGGALARRLLATGELVVHDLRPEVVVELEAMGAVGTASADELAQSSEVILLCLPRSADVRSAIFGPSGLLEGLTPGKIVIDQTSGDPDETRAMASELAQHGVTMIDAPVSGGPRGAEAGTVAIMVGASGETFDQVQPILARISPNIFHCGDVGSGHVMKLVNNTLSASCRLATLEAVAMGRKYGLELDVMTEVLDNGSGHNRTTEIMLPLLVKGRRSSSFAMELMLKDLTLATRLGQNCGAPMLVANVARALLQTGVNLYGTAATMDETVTLIETMAGTTIASRAEPTA